jgi:hypothetical protein
VSHREVVRGWRSEVTAHPQANTVKVCHEGAVKSPWNKFMTNIPKDETMKAATTMSSSKTL